MPNSCNDKFTQWSGSRDNRDCEMVGIFVGQDFVGSLNN